MSNIDKQALRERYSEKPAPKCHICGSVMTIQRASAGSIVYGCTGRIDKDGEGYKFAEGRDFADDHYARSRVTEYGPGGDPEVLALLDDLAAAEHAAAVDHEAACSLVEENEEVKRKLSAAEKRIAELEALAKSVKFDPIPMEELGNKSDGKKHPYMFGAGYNSAVVHCESMLLQAFAAAGIGKGE